MGTARSPHFPQEWGLRGKEASLLPLPPEKVGKDRVATSLIAR